MLALEAAHSIRFLYRHFLAGITEKSLNAFYYACSYAKIDCSAFMNTTARIEQKTFWSLCHYMIRSSKGIEMMVNLINISYSAMKILPYKYTEFSEYQNQSVQDFRFALGKQIREDVFVWTFEKKLEKAENSEELLKALDSLIFNQKHQSQNL